VSGNGTPLPNCPALPECADLLNIQDSSGAFFVFKFFSKLRLVATCGETGSFGGVAPFSCFREDRESRVVPDMRAVAFVVTHSTIIGRSRRPNAQRATETSEGLEENAHEGHGPVNRDDQDLDDHIWALIDLVPRAATPGSAPHDRRLPGP
jgi:hypothetical protein